MFRHESSSADAIGILPFLSSDFLVAANRNARGEAPDRRQHRSSRQSAGLRSLSWLSKSRLVDALVVALILAAQMGE